MARRLAKCSSKEELPMSDQPQIRRADKLMPEESTLELISLGVVGRLATVGPDGWPYVIPLLYVWKDAEIWLHTTHAHGHLRTNVEHESRVSFEIDEPGKIFSYGPYHCNTSIAYRSAVIFGRIRMIDDEEERKAFFDAFMEKYADPSWDRPKGVYPTLDQVTVYKIVVERLTGKETRLPLAENR